ncbi:MAG: sigma-70 family RNA polymerase sigma factor [bacterium]|nr:sigma-70 family RNA polymerase sigma factor [bacterium]
MQRRSDEDLFLAYRRHHDCDALGMLFRRHVEELLRLAVFLAERPSDAEDLVQATFLSAISRADTFATDGRVMSWLCGILTNHARMLRRADRRRRSRVDARSELPTLPANDARPAPEPVSAALRAEVRQALDHGIKELPEPYRSVLTLYLREGLDSREISERLARPRATVRKQMARAIERLRGALPLGLATALLVKLNPAQIATHAAEAARFVEPVEPLTSVAREPVAAETSTALPQLALGVGFGLAAMGLIALVLVVTQAGTGDTDPGAIARAATASVTSRVANAPAARGSSKSGADLTSSERSTARDRSRLRLQVVGLDGRPRAAVGLALVRLDGRALPERWFDPSTRQFLTDGEGAADLVDLRPGPWQVALPGALPRLRVDLLPGDNQARLELPPSVEFDGRVTDHRGRPVADAEIVVSETSGRGDLGAGVAHSDALGRFRATSLIDRARVFARHPDHGRSTSMRIEAGGSVRLELEAATRTVAVHVTNAAGDPIPAAYVALAPRSQATDMVLPQHAIADTDGKARFADPGARSTTIVASAPGYAPSRTALPQDADHAVVVLTAGGTVRGIAVDEAGRPLAGRPVAATLTQPRSNDPAGPLLARMVRTDATGTFLFERLPVGPIKIWIGGHDASESLHPFLNRYIVAGVDVDVQLAGDHEVRLTGHRPHELSGQLRSASGTPLAGWHVVAIPTDGVTFHRLGRGRSAKTGPEGTFVIAGVAADTRYCLGAFPPGAASDRLDRFPVATQFASVDEERHDFVVQTARPPSGRLRLRVLAPDGTPATRTTIELRHREFCYPMTQRTAAGGECDFGMLAPGDYYLAMVTSGAGTLTIPVTMPADGSDIDLGAVQLEYPTQLTVHADHPSGDTVAGLRVVGRLAIGDKFVSARTDYAGQAMLPPLPPGNGRVLVHGPGIAPVERDVRFEPGRQWLAVELEPATAVTFAFEFAPVENPFVIDGPLRVQVHDSNGRLVLADNVGAAKSPGLFELATGLLPGRYVVTARSLWNASARAEIDVPETGTQSLRLRLEP